MIILSLFLIIAGILSYCFSMKYQMRDLEFSLFLLPLSIFLLSIGLFILLSLSSSSPNKVKTITTIDTILDSTESHDVVFKNKVYRNASQTNYYHIETKQIKK